MQKMLSEINQEQSVSQEQVVSGMMEGCVRDIAVKESILQYVYALQEGFIMVKIESTSLNKEYRTNIGLYALNEERFKRSRLIYYPEPKDWSLAPAHSLLRPTLTNLSWWGL